MVILSPFLPYPEAKAGAPQAIYDRLCLLTPHHRVLLVTFMQQGEERYLAHLRGLGIAVRPVLRRTYAKGLPLWRKRFRLAMSLLLGKVPLLVAEFESREMRRSVRQALEQVRPDVLLVEHRLVARYLIDMPAGVQRHAVFSEHDVCGGPDGLSAGPFAPLLSKVEARRWASFNPKVWRSASAVLVPTREDAAVLLSRAPGVRVEVVPYGLVRPGLCEGSSEERSGDMLLFVGNFDHPPNREAALLLARTIFPKVQRSVPHAQLVLVGKNPTAEIEALASRSSGITVTGEVESVGPYLYGCALFVAPLVSGGGARMKLMEAMMAGAPIITTPLGARGLEAQPGKHILVAGPGDDFAQMVVSALRDPHLRERLGTAARNLYCTRDRTEERAQRLNALLERYAR